MKTTALIFGLILSHFILHSQSLRETELWIGSKIENFGEKKSKYEYNYAISFIEETMVVVENRWSLDNPTKTVEIFDIPIKHINNVYFEEYINNSILMVVEVHPKPPDYNCVTAYEYLKEDYSLVDSARYVEMKFQLREEVLEEDLPNRIIKAFNHLIELHGGEVVKEVF